MAKILAQLNGLLWGIPALLLLAGVGIALSIQLRFVQLRLLPDALGTFFQKLRHRDASFRALCTALGATVGTGNLVGVAGAICLGGPGTVFWMWLCGLLGMATKYAEATLAVRYRVQEKGSFFGGPMYMITRGLGKPFHPLAKLYCVFGMLAAFGVGCGAQVNAAVSAVKEIPAFTNVLEGRGLVLPGLIAAVLTGKLLLGGAGKIASYTERLVPLAAAGYIALCAGVLVVHADRIGWAFGQICLGAFDPKAVTGGILGSGFQALRIGCSRGVFTNEAGMGTASIAHAVAKVEHPAQQGLMGIMEVFLDTEVICTLTALVILVSGVPVAYGQDLGAVLTGAAFASVYGSLANWLIALMLVCFALASILGWGFYGARCAQFLFGQGIWPWYVLALSIGAAYSAVADSAIVWQFSETMNGLMVIPNLITLALLTPEVRCLTKDYLKIRRINAGGGYYADFHQCKPL